MSETLFHPVQEGHDPQGRPVFVGKDEHGYFVYKPRTGFTSKHFKKQDDINLLEIFEYQKACGQNHAFYRKGDQARAKVVKHPATAGSTKTSVLQVPAQDGANGDHDKEIYTV